MPIGSFTISGAPTQLFTTAPQALVCLYDREGQGMPALPNVRVVRIDVREGPAPPTATFTYVQDDRAQAFGWPSQFEQLWPLDTQGNYVVQCDDELVVVLINPDGSLWIPFDGFASIPQVDYTAKSQSVRFTAQNVAIRYFDEPLTDSVHRNADQAGVTDGSQDVRIPSPPRFNPADNSLGRTGGYVGNCVPPSGDTENDDTGDYPVFLDPLVIERDETATSYWYISDALIYLMATYQGEEYATWPDFDELVALLNAQYAPSGDPTFNPDDADSADISIQDYDGANKALPTIFADLLGYAGFLMYWSTNADSDNEPETTLQLYRRDAASTVTPKPIYLAPNGTSSLNLAQNNASACHLARDTNQIVNAWEIESQPKQWEVTVILAPGFEPQAGDQISPARDAFKEANLTNATGMDRRKYRWWIADECADGHWDAVDDQWQTNVSLDLSPVFPPDANGKPTYVKRYRPGRETLIAQDDQGRPLKAVLEYQKSWSPRDPFVLGVDSEDDSPGPWLTVPNGWRLLPDRLGIEVTAADPEQWATGNPKIGDIHAILWSATPTTQTQFALRLTTVIEADQGLNVSAPRRIASPTQYSRVRVADGRDHFQYNAISVNSLNYDGDGTNPEVIRDDTDLAQAHAYALRSAHEFPTLAGSVTIPWLTDFYKIGDRVSIIKGRNATLQTNIGIDQGEAPSYPWVVGVSWVFEPEQQTILQLSDSRAEPQPYRG
jgi:hypothetical protein